MNCYFVRPFAGTLKCMFACTHRWCVCMCVREGGVLFSLWLTANHNNSIFSQQKNSDIPEKKKTQPTKFYEESAFACIQWTHMWAHTPPNIHIHITVCDCVEYYLFDIHQKYHKYCCQQRIRRQQAVSQSHSQANGRSNTHIHALYAL